MTYFITEMVAYSLQNASAVKKWKKRLCCHHDPATGRPNLIWLDRLHKHIFICLFVVKTPEGLSGDIQTANSFDIFLFPTSWEFLRGTGELKERSPSPWRVSRGMWRCARIRRWYLATLKGKRQSARLQQVKWHAHNTKPCRSHPTAQFLPPPAARWDYFSLAKCQGHDSLRCPAGNNPLLPSKQMKPLRANTGVIYWRWKAKNTVFSVTASTSIKRVNTYIKHQSWRWG